MHSISKSAANDLGEIMSLLETNTSGVMEKLRKAKEKGDRDRIKIYEIELAKLARGEDNLRYKKTLY